MNKALILAITAAVAACTPGPNKDPQSADDGPPPVRFRGDVEATRVSFTANPEKACRAAGLKNIGEAGVRACSITGGGRREVIIRNPCKASGQYARDLCHELGHLNGWPGDHPQ